MNQINSIHQQDLPGWGQFFGYIWIGEIKDNCNSFFANLSSKTCIAESFVRAPFDAGPIKMSTDEQLNHYFAKNNFNLLIVKLVYFSTSRRHSISSRQKKKFELII
ncbi:hypothetical protein DERP_005907 [Dermatophagoides pteronyssinus]|uniref:Uncharacterized protein n=1 Tax=Dermatophagoides pteronyssinus TaxID=6956 RepID=A0ABQ8JRR2_DERPT|nr:hypothetical protein DERP_005907 [Dermatophagoides pteronyssinus]